MAEVTYKQYSEEESRIYNEALAKIREGIANGLNFSEATSVVNIGDAELEKLVIDDALKILIAEMHFAKGELLYKVADTLKVPLKTVNKAHMEMLEDAGIAAAETYSGENPEGLFGNA